MKNSIKIRLAIITIAIIGFLFYGFRDNVRYFITGKAIQQVPYLILILISQLGYLNPQAKR